MPSAQTRENTGRTGAERPFIIHTLQRTGGTNLTKHLNRLSSFPVARQHEPFNRPRVYGHVTRAWEADRDAEALYAAMRVILAGEENIKHCVEMVPWKITGALVDCATEAGYRHMFLYRRDALGRILSMEYAQRTKIWGPSHLDKLSGDAVAFETPLDVDALVANEARCNRLLNRTWNHLAAAGVRAEPLAFEDLYGPDAALAGAALTRILTHLGLSKGAEADAELLAILRGDGGQQTRDRYVRFQGIAELRDRLADLEQPVFDTPGPVALTEDAR